MARKDWTWQPHAGHFILGDKCIYHLNTYLGNGYMVSTIGELWNDRSAREIHAKVHDIDWHLKNNKLKGDSYDRAYFKRFGYQDIGYQRKYETMVFRAKKSSPLVECCEYEMESATNLDFDSYNDAKEANIGHMNMCKKWSRKHNTMRGKRQ